MEFDDAENSLTQSGALVVPERSEEPLFTVKGEKKDLPYATKSGSMKRLTDIIYAS